MNKIKITNSVSYYTIDEHNQAQRIDNFLISYLKGVPRGHIYKIIRKGEVRVNKGRIKPTYKLQSGDIVRIPPVSIDSKEHQPAPGSSLLTFLDSQIIYEDDGIIAVNKPSGLAVHGGSGISHGLIEAMRALRPEQKFLELVHRLDRDTSGCILLAKKRSVLTGLHQALRDNETDKRYLALLCGKIYFDQKHVNVPLLKNTLQSGERVVRVDKEGKESSSYFSRREVFSDASLVEIRIQTGRTHQIRVHAQYLGFPVAGDEKYSNYACNQRMKQKGLRRLFLHAHSIKFKHPLSGKLLMIEAPLAEELQQVLVNLR